MTTVIAFMTLIMIARLALPDDHPSQLRTALVSIFLIFGVVGCFEMNSGTLILIALLLAIHLLAEHAFPDAWRLPIRVLTLFDALILLLLLTWLPWVTLTPHTWLQQLTGFNLKYLALAMGALLLAREIQWLQLALGIQSPEQRHSVWLSGITERGLMYAGLVVGLPYWWLLGVLAVKGIFMRTQRPSEVGAVWISSIGSALITLLVFDLIRRGVSS